MRISKWKALAALLSASAAVTAHGQTSLTGSSMALKSSGSATLSSSGYVGTYLTVPAGGSTINFTVNANESSGSGGDPHMNLVIADTTVGFNVNSTTGINYSTGNITLPAGTARDVIAEINRVLVEGGIAVYRLQEIQASLESWFLQVTSRLGAPE